MDEGSRGASGGRPSVSWGADGKLEVPWIPACAGMTEERGGNEGWGGWRERGVSGGGPSLIWGAGGRLEVAWIPACAGMTEERGGNDGEGWVQGTWRERWGAGADLGR